MRFEGTPWETDTCPRRHLLRYPQIAALQSTWTACEGNLGSSVLDVSHAAVEAMNLIGSGVRYREEQDREAGKAARHGGK